MRVGTELLDGDASLAEFTRMADVPALQARICYLGMELQRQSVVFNGKGLIFIEIGLGEMENPGRQIEGIAVPVKDVKVFGEERSEPVRRRCHSGCKIGNQPISGP